ncbi:hypothetical protein [Streptomyces sp. 5-10]|uniref:hypothetical protein n=1 Tax=Streptomyces sp. 5-10 TaxID=878925 RepID=UPI00168BF920|nr:hypothetical protein [Streptomyces sp. 5-10]MBD3004893.1 hypothetical protein [Streptomyces sp. 5-10]
MVVPRQTQLTVGEYEQIERKVSQPPTQNALRDAIGGYVTCAARTAVLLHRHGLISADDRRLTPLGWKVRGALAVRPGTLGSRVVQTLIDAGLVWKELPGRGGLRGTFTVDSEDPDSSVFVTCRTLNGAPDVNALAAAEQVLMATGFQVQRVVDIVQRLLVTEDKR